MRGRVYWPQLDGIRTLAVTAVFAFHASYGKIRGGFLGVDLFFVLSGFLITTLLANEIDHNQRINFRLFYIRRFLRLYPALMVLVLAAGFFWSLVPPPAVPYSRMAAAALFYYANFVGGNTLIPHTWSLSIEEQFYILWPCLLGLIWGGRFRRWYLIPTSAIIISAILVRIVMTRRHVGIEDIYRFTLARMDSLIIGATLALIVRQEFVARFVETRKAVMKAVGGLGLVSYVSLVLWADKSVFPVWGYTAISIVFALFIGSVVLIAPRGSLLNRLLSTDPMTWIGKRAYGIYLYHLPIVGISERFRVHHSVANFLAIEALRIVGTIVVAALSYELVEKRFLALKHRFEPNVEEVGLLGSAKPPNLVSD